MGLETATYISDLNPANPTGSDARSTGDDHLRLIKSAIKTTFPNISGAVTPSQSVLNKLGTTAAPGDSSTDPASTAYVLAALSAASTNGAMIMRVSSSVTDSPGFGEHVVMTNGAAGTVTLPSAPANGSRVWATFTNGLTTNVIARNGASINGAGADYVTGGTIKLRYVASLTNWIVESAVAAAASGGGALTLVARQTGSSYYPAANTRTPLGGTGVYVYLPSGAAANSEIELFDSDGATHVVDPNGIPLNGSTSALAMGYAETIRMVYISAATGWVIQSRFTRYASPESMKTVFATGPSYAAKANERVVITYTPASAIALPASPINGMTVQIVVANGSLANVVQVNGSSINGAAADQYIDIKNACLTFLFIDSTRGWRVF